MKAEAARLIPAASTSAASDPTNQPILKELLEKLPAAAYTCNREGLITYFNGTAEKMWGRAPKLNDPADRFCGSFKLFLPDGTPITHKECWMAMALQNNNEYAGEEIIVERPGGERLTALAHATPIRDESGDVIGAINILVDITERKQAEFMRARMAAIVESSDDAIISKSLDGFIQSWNNGARKLFGYDADEIIGKHITTLIPPELRQEEDYIIGRLRRGERLEHYETVRLHKDGHRMDISLSVSPIYDSSGKVVAASKIARDISLQKQAEAILRDADRRKNEFLAILAHELRNPLAPIRNGLHILQSDIADPTIREQAHNMMARQVDQLVRLVDDLLDISRITCGKVELRKESMDLASAIHSAVESAKPWIEARHHKLTLELPKEPISINADFTRFSQIFANLLNNAAKYTEPGGQIGVTVKQTSNDLRIEIRDTGIGISAENLPHIFDMFTQAHTDAINRTHGGLGIGLTLVKNLVEMHGGTVKAYSAGLNHGSTFTVSLPASMIIGYSSPETSVPANTPAKSSALRVLVVDDNEASAKTMGWTMELMGHEVRLAHNGMDALKVAEDFIPNLVLLDIGLPNMNGYEVCQRMRQNPELKDTLFVAQTGWGQEEHRRRSQEAGFHHHLVKPVNMEKLQELLVS